MTLVSVPTTTIGKARYLQVTLLSFAGGLRRGKKKKNDDDFHTHIKKRNPTATAVGNTLVLTTRSSQRL